MAECDKPKRKKVTKKKNGSSEKCGISKLQEIANFAKLNKIQVLKVDGIEMAFHPEAFIEKPEVKPAPAPKDETPEERAEREKKELEENLFWST